MVASHLKHSTSSATDSMAVKQTEKAIVAYIKGMRSNKDYMDEVAKQTPGYANPDVLEKNMTILVKSKENLVLDYINAVDKEHQVIAKHIPDYKPSPTSFRSDEEKEKLEAALQRLSEGQRKDIQEAVNVSKEKRFNLADELQGENARNKGFDINPASEISMRIVLAAVIQGKRNFIERVSVKEKEKEKKSGALLKPNDVNTHTVANPNALGGVLSLEPYVGTEVLSLGDHRITPSQPAHMESGRLPSPQTPPRHGKSPAQPSYTGQIS